MYEIDTRSFEEDIRETVHDPVVIGDPLRKCGFEAVKCADRLPDNGDRATTWFVIAGR